MEKLCFTPGDGGSADPDARLIADDELERAASEGKRRG
jgi:hypothetical protein